jgi:hypothetical protein
MRGGPQCAMLALALAQRGKALRIKGREIRRSRCRNGRRVGLRRWGMSIGATGFRCSSLSFSAL